MTTCREKDISSLLIRLNSRFWILGTTGRPAKTFPMNGRISQRRSISRQWMALRRCSFIPLLAEEGWRDSLIEAGAPGAKREPGRAKPQLVVSSAKSTGCRSDHPVCAASVASRHFLSAQPPILCEEGNTAIHRQKTTVYSLLGDLQSSSE